MLYDVSDAFFFFTRQSAVLSKEIHQCKCLSRTRQAEQCSRPCLIGNVWKRRVEGVAGLLRLVIVSAGSSPFCPYSSLFPRLRRASSPFLLLAMVSCAHLPTESCRVRSTDGVGGGGGRVLRSAMDLLVAQHSRRK